MENQENQSEKKEATINEKIVTNKKLSSKELKEIIERQRQCK